jgi:hypothetical protein
LEILKGRDHSEGLGAGGRTIFMGFKEIVLENVDWSDGSC